MQTSLAHTLSIPGLHVVRYDEYQYMPSPDLEKHPGRPFSFHPPIFNIEHNEWIYMKGSWSEILVQNTGTGMDLWIPQRFIGEISGLDDPVMTAALTQELEYKGGTVWPLQRSVVDMPPASKPRTGCTRAV